MADNIAISSGSGTTVATDERTIGAVAAHVQRVAPSLGPEGTHTGNLSGRLVDGTASEAAAYVDPRLKVVRLAVTPTISTSPAYTAKDAVGGLMTFSNAVRASGGSGTLLAVQVEDKGQQMKDLDLVLFDRTLTAPTDNSIFAPSDAELATCIGVIPITAGAYADFSTNSVADAYAGLPKPFVLNGTDLFGVLVARGTPTYTSTGDLVVTLTIQQD